MFTKCLEKIFAIFAKKKFQKTLLFILVTLVTLLSLFPRSIDVLNGNPIFGFDQGRDYLAAQNIIVNHKLTLIGAEIGAGMAGISGVFQGPVFYYLLTIFYVVFSGDPVGGGILMLLFSFASIYFGFYFGKKLFGLFYGIVIAMLISISPIFISQARFIWNPNLPTLFTLLSLYFFYLFVRDRKNRAIFLAAFFAGFIYNFEIAIAIPLALTIIIYTPLLVKKRIESYLLLVLGLIAAFLPMILFELKHNFLGARGMIAYLFTYKSSSLSTLSYFPDHLNAFLNNFKGTFPIDDLYFARFFMAVLFAIVIYLLSREKNIAFKHFFSFLLVVIVVSFIVFSFLKNAVYDYYLTDINLCYMFLFTYLIYSFFKQRLYFLSLCFLILITVFVIFGVNSAIKTSIYDYFDYGSTAKLKGKIEAIDYIYKDAKEKKFNLLVFSPPVYTYPYDYLLSWYGKKEYGFVPGKEKKATLYLLIEKDTARPWTYEGWLKTVIKSGKIVKTVVLPRSGFIVQKRVFE